MGDVLRKTGTNYVLLFPDDRTNTTLNSSTPGADGIATTNFEGMLLKDGEVVATNLAALEAAPYNMTIDNVSGAFGVYKVNIDIPTRGTFDLYLRHSSDMVVVRHEQFDLLTRGEISSLFRGNVRWDFNIATVAVPARNVAIGVLDTIRLRSFDGVTVVEDRTVEMVYATSGDTNPINAIPA